MWQVPPLVTNVNGLGSGRELSFNQVDLSVRVAAVAVIVGRGQGHHHVVVECKSVLCVSMQFSAMHP